MAQAATAGELTLYRTPGKKTKLRAAIFQPTTIWTGRVDHVFTSWDGILEIPYDAGTSTTNVREDMTVFVGSTAGAHDIGIARVRSIDSSKVYIGETSDVKVLDNHYLTIVDDFGLWARHVLIDDGVSYMDGGIAYTNQHRLFDPVPIMGGPRVLKLTGSTVSTTFDFSDSYVIGSTITGYSCSAPGSSSSSGMTTAAPTITWNTVGWYKVYLTLTAANGKSYLAIRYVYIWNDANPPPRVQLNSDCRQDAEEGGWSYDITLTDDCDVDSIRDHALVVLFKEDYYGSTQSNIGPVAGCENIEVVGWIAKESIDWNPEQGSVRFSIQGAQYWFGQIPSYPDGVELVSRPAAAWTEMQGLTVRKGLYHFLRWRTTAMRIMDVFLPSDTKYTKEVSSLAQNLWEQIREMAFLQIFARAGVNAQGQLFIDVHPQLVKEADRTWPTVMTIAKQDWVGEIDFERVTKNEVSQVRVSGVAVNESGKGTPYFSLSTGHTLGHYGQLELQDNLLVSGQSDANDKAGLYYGWRNNPYPDIPIVFDADIALIDCFPNQQCDITIGASDTPRGNEYSGGLIPKSITVVQDPETGYVHREVTFEAETFQALAVKETVPGSGEVSIPPTPPLPPLPPIEVIVPGTTVPTEDGGPPKVLGHDTSVGLLYTENFNESSPEWRTVNAGLDNTQYPYINEIVLTPSGEIYVAFVDYNSTGHPSNIFIAYAPSIGATFTVLEDVTSIRAKHAGTVVSIRGLALNELTGQVGYILVGETSDAKLYVGSGTSFTGSIITGYQYAAPHYPASLSYGFGNWVITGPKNAFVVAGWFRMSADGTSLVASGNMPVSTYYYHLRASTTDLIYHFSDTDGTCRSSTGNCAAFSGALGDGLLNAGVYNRHACDPTGTLWMLSYGGLAGKGRSSDGIATIVGIPSLPAGNHYFAYAGGEDVESRWVVVSAIIRYSPDDGDTWEEKGGNILSISPIPILNVVRVVEY